MSRDFKNHLQKQLKLLQKASIEYDYGDIDEAINIAIRLRVLLHDKGRSTSLLTHLKQKNKLYFISTLESVEEYRKKLLTKHGMIINQYDPPAMLVNDERKPPFGSWGIKKYFPFDVWWNEKILKINDKEYSRADIVLITAEQEGGAHIDSKVNEKTKLLEYGTGRVKYGLGSGQVKKELTNTHYLFLRQIAYELLSIEKLFTENSLEFTQPICETVTYNGLIQKAENFLEQKQMHHAKSCLEKAIKYDPSRKEAYNNIANIFQDFDDIDEAILNYSKAIELDGNYLDAQFNLANIYLKQRKYSFALDLYENILSKNSDEYKTKHNLNYILHKLKDEKERLYQYENFFNESNNRLYLDVLGLGLFQDKEFQKAYFVFEKSLKLFGESPMILSNLAATLIKLKRYKQAEEIFKSLIRQEKIDNHEVCINILEYMVSFGQNIDSLFIENCEKLFQKNGENAVYFDIMKTLYETIQGEDTENKLSSLKKQCHTKKINFDFSDMLSMADYNSLNVLKNAINYLKK